MCRGTSGSLYSLPLAQTGTRPHPSHTRQSPHAPAPLSSHVLGSGQGRQQSHPPPISALPLINHTPTTPPGPLTPSAASRRPHKAPPMWWGYIDTIDAFRAPSWASRGLVRFRRLPAPPIPPPGYPSPPLPFLGRVTRRVPLLAHADSPPMHPMSLPCGRGGGGVGLTAAEARGGRGERVQQPADVTCLQCLRHPRD